LAGLWREIHRFFQPWLGEITIRISRSRIVSIGAHPRSLETTGLDNIKIFASPTRAGEPLASLSPEPARYINQNRPGPDLLDADFGATSYRIETCR
jgi:hypothetical protein